MSPEAQIARLRSLCAGAVLLDEGGAPLVHLPDMKVESAGSIHPVDGLLCPRPRDGYESRMFFSIRLPVDRNWNSHALFTRTWWAHSWQGIPAEQPWLDILACHLETVR